MKYTMQRQRGIGLLALFFFLCLAVFVVTVAAKLGPHYMEFLTIRSVMQELQEDPALSDVGKSNVLATVGKRLYINNVKSVATKDFHYKPTKNGYTLSVDYKEQEHLFGNLDVVMTFSHEVQVDKK